MLKKRKPDALERLAQRGRELVIGTSTTATGAGVGSLVGGPLGTIAGAGAGATVEQVFRLVSSELASRNLAARAEARVGAAATFALGAISSRLLAGEDRRRDDFFSSDVAGRSPAEELLEGVLVAAEDTYEERKLPYMGNLYAAFVFDASISPARAHQMLTVASRLTYRQLVILGAWELVPPRPFGLPMPVQEPDRQRESTESLSIRADMFALVQQSIAWVGQGSEWPSIPQQLDPAEFQAAPLGEALIKAMRLDLIPEAERRELLATFASPAPSDSAAT